MQELQLVAIGALPQGILQHLGQFLAPRVGVPCRVPSLAIDPAPAYESQRGQVDCRRLFPVLEDLARETRAAVLGVADVDLFSAIFTFVFGESRLGGEAAMMSLHRLRPELYGLPENPQLLVERTEREALHEVGHLLGLVHCHQPDCVMRFSGSVEEVDLKQSRFCPACEAHRSQRRPTSGG